MKKCSSCGFLVNDDVANFCPECGNPLIAVDNCESTVSTASAATAEPSAADDTFSSDNNPSASVKTSDGPTPADLGIVHTGYIPEVPADIVEILPAPDDSEPKATADAAADTSSAYASSASSATVAADIPSGASQFSSDVSASDVSADTSQFSSGAASSVNSADSSTGFSSAPVAPGITPIATSAGTSTETSSYTGPQPLENVQPVQPGPAQPGQLSRAAIVEILDRNTDMTAKVLGSCWFVISMIGLVIATCANLVNSIVQYIEPLKATDYKWLVDAFKELGIDFADAVDAFNKVRIQSMITSIILMIPVIISCIGMVRMFLAHKQRPVPFSGTTMAKTNLVFRLIIVCLAAIFTICVLIASFLLGDEIYDYYYFGYEINASTAFRIALVFAAIILIGVFLCFIFYYIGMIKTLSVVKKAGWEGKCPKNRVSIYAAVINIVAAVFMTIIFVNTVTDIDGLASVISSVTSCGLILYFLGAGMAMFRLKDSLTELPGIK